MRRLNVLCILCFCLAACAGRVLQYDKADDLISNEEYDKQVQVKVVEPPIAPVVTPAPAETVKPEVKAPPTSSKAVKSAAKKSGKSKTKDHGSVIEKGPRQPDIEDSVGFEGRRPLKDPFRVGEKVVFSLSYFNVVAGTLEFAVKPMVEVNGQKAYHFEVTAKSNSLFSRVYAVDDKATTYLSYNELIPLNLEITLKESKQLAETRTFIDWKTNKATYWRRKVTDDKGEQKKKIDWNVLPYSQNVISAVYYMRTFSYMLDKSYAFRVADEGKNIVFKGEVIRKEKLKTDVGVLDTLVLKPHITVDGVFKPVGEILFWMTDDDRKFIVRIESKIKIGTLVAKLKSLEKGQD